MQSQLNNHEACMDSILFEIHTPIENVYQPFVATELLKESLLSRCSVRVLPVSTGTYTG